MKEPPNGSPGPHAGNPAQWGGFHRRLCAVRERLLSIRQGLIRDSRLPIESNSHHLADVATDEIERDVDLGLLACEEDALFEVEEALRRIERGTYGKCEITGRAIPIARLRAIPWTRFTAEAEMEMESKGVVKKAHLGPLGGIE